MDNTSKQKDDEIIICRCEELSKKDIIDAINEGAKDFRGIKIRTRAGMGLCQGKSCENNIRKILAEVLNKKPENLPPTTKRPPVRPLNIGYLGRKVNEQ